MHGTDRGPEAVWCVCNTSSVGLDLVVLLD